MKPKLYFFLYLNIYCCLFWNAEAQEPRLSIKAEKPITKGLNDSLKLPIAVKNTEALHKQIDTLQFKLQHMGYIDSRMVKLEKRPDSNYVAHFELGEKYREVKIYYNAQNFTKKQLQTISTAVSDSVFILPIETIPAVLEKLTALRNQKGHAFARLRLTSFEKTEKNKLAARLWVDDGKPRQIDSIALKGYTKFPRSFLKYYTGIKKGTTFNQKKLVNQSETLNELGFVSTLKPPEALFRKDTTVVYLYLKKENNNQFDGILGFATHEKTQKVAFNGYLNLELNNNLNYGEQLLLNYKADGDEQVNFRVKATLPYLFRTPFGISGELRIFKRDSSFITTEQQWRTTYQASPRLSTYLGYKAFESSNLLDEVLAGSPVEDYKSNFFIVGTVYRKLQHRKLFPLKTFIEIDGALGNRSTAGNKDGQVRLETAINHTFNLNRENSIYVANSSSVLFSDTYLVNELFRFGGINSIRGFDENSIDASLFSVLNTEYRYQFSESLYVHSIIDAGYFENQARSLSAHLYSFGLGLGLNTKAGLFKLNIANGQADDQDFNFANTKIHISLSSKF